MVEQLLHAGCLATSRANSQPWRFIVIRDENVKNSLFSAVYHQYPILDAPVVIAVLGIIDPRSSVPQRALELVQANAFNVVIKDLADHMLDSWNPEDLKTDAALNSAITATHIALAAHALGLGCCWIKLWKDNEALSILRVPEGYCLAGLLVIGYPDENPEARPRLPIVELVYHNRFGETFKENS